MLFKKKIVFTEGMNETLCSFDEIPWFPVVEFRMINHRITHIFRKRTQNEQKNYCCIQRTTQEPSALRICSKKAFVVQIPLFCKRLGGSFTRMNSCHVWRPVGALMKKEH